MSSLFYEILLEYHARQAGVTLSVRGFPAGIREWWIIQQFKGWGAPAITEAAVHTVWLVLLEKRYYEPRHRLLSVLTDMVHSVTPLLPAAAGAGQQLYRIEL